MALPLCWANAAWHSPYAESSRSTIFLMMSQSGLPFHKCLLCNDRVMLLLCWANAAWDSPYAESTRNTIPLMLNQSGMNVKKSWSCVEWHCWVSAAWHSPSAEYHSPYSEYHSPYAESTLSTIFLMLSQSGITFHKCWSCLEIWHCPYAELPRNVSTERLDRVVSRKSFRRLLGTLA
jgi:hypothetical protein